MSDSKSEMTNWEKCKYNYPKFTKDRIQFICTESGKNLPVEKTDCEKCPHCKSRYIEYPITVSKINKNTKSSDLHKNQIGSLCEIRKVSNDDKTYIGILIGELPIDIITSHNSDTNELNVSFMTNPAIFIPELKQVVYGCESWWRILEPDQLPKNITDEDIENQWYVKLFKALHEPQNENTDNKKGE